MPVVAARYALAGVVTTVDAEHGARTLDAHAEAVKQVAVADRLVVTKVDRVEDATVGALESRLAALNPAAPILRSRLGDADPARLFDAGLHRLDGPPDAAGWLAAGAYRSFAPRGNHDPNIASFVWTLDAPVDAEDFRRGARDPRGAARLPHPAHERAGARFRPRGPDGVHAVQHTLYPPAWLARWPDNDRRTRLVFIGNALEEASVAQILNSFLASKPRHGLQR
jgi:G3E family GTPase